MQEVQNPKRLTLKNYRKPPVHRWRYICIYAESHKIEMCIWRSLYFDNFQNKKNKKKERKRKKIFHNLVRSIHLTTSRSIFSEGNVCTHIAGRGWIFFGIGRILASHSWKVRAVQQKCCVYQRAMSFLSPLIKMVKTRNWKWIQEVDMDRISFWHWLTYTSYSLTVIHWMTVVQLYLYTFIQLIFPTIAIAVFVLSLTFVARRSHKTTSHLLRLLRRQGALDPVPPSWALPPYPVRALAAPGPLRSVFEELPTFTPCKCADLQNYVTCWLGHNRTQD